MTTNENGNFTGKSDPASFVLGHAMVVDGGQTV
jgi:hypothetical protein